MPYLTNTTYPRGGVRFEEWYIDELTGLPMYRTNAIRDFYTTRLVRDPDEPGRDDLLKSFHHREERVDIDP